MIRGLRGTLPAAIAAALVVIASLGVACDAAIEDPTPTPSPTPVGIAAPRVQLIVGVSQSLTGAGAVYGKTTVEGINLAIEAANASGRVGVELAPIVVDDQSTSAGASAASAQLLAQRPGVILGSTLSAVAPETHRPAQAAGIPVLASTTVAPDITDTGDYIFRVALGEEDVVPSVIADIARRQPLRRAVLILDSRDTFSRISAAAMRTGMTAVGGSIVTEIDVATTDVTQALASFDPSVDAFLVTSLIDEAAKAVVAVRAAGFKQPIIGGNTFNSLDIARLAGPAIEGAYTGADWNPALTTASSKAFVSAYQQRYGREPDLFAAQGYASIEILVDAFQRAGSTDPKALRDAIAATKDLETVVGKLSMSPKRNAVHPPVTQRFEGGKLVIVP